MLTVGMEEPGALDPALARTHQALAILPLIYQPLVRWEGGKLVPGLARSWRPEDGGRIWVFQLDPGARFHDGRPVGAGDVKAALERVASRATGSESAYLLSEVRGFARAREGSFPGLEGVEVVDTYTLRIVLDRPDYDFPAVLTHPALAPVGLGEGTGSPAPGSPLAQSSPGPGSGRPPGGTAPAGETPGERPRVPPGTGPYRVVSAGKEGVTLERVWGHGPARISIRFFATVEQAWEAYLKGSVDAAEVPAGEVVLRPKEVSAGGGGPLWASSALLFNLADPILGKLEVRRGLSLAVDREALVASVYRGLREPATSLLPPGLPGAGSGRCEACRFSPEEARSLLSGAAGGAGFVLDYLEEGAGPVEARRLAEGWQALGVRVSLRGQRAEELLARLARGEFQVALFGWVAEYPSAGAFLDPLFRSGSRDNYARFSSPELDRALEAARTEPDAGRRAEKWAEAERLVLGALPWAPLTFYRNHWALRRPGLRLDERGFLAVAGASAGRSEPLWTGQGMAIIPAEGSEWRNGRRASLRG